MITLREYQSIAINGVRQAFAQGIKKLILCAPTGAGKTIMFSYIAANAIKRGNTVMIVCDRKELITQSKEKLNTLGLHPTIIAPGHKQIINNCYLASVDTLIRRQLPKIDILIIDEAHKQTFDKICHEYPDIFVIGATATPIRTGQQKALSHIYQQIIEPVKISWLIKNNWLCEPVYYAAKIDLSDVKTLGGDYETSQLFKKFDRPKLYAGVLEKYQSFANGQKAIVFNINKEHTEKMCQEFNQAGISAKYIISGISDQERKEILRQFAAGEFQVLCNCGVLTTGFDDPSIQCVIVNRATLSLALWLQMLGRGGRPSAGKSNFTIIDMGGNVYKHGFWEEEREWTLEKPVRNKKIGVAPVKDCPSCQAIVPAHVPECKYCGHVFAKKEKKLIEAEFVKISKDIPLPQIRGAGQMKNLHQIAKEKGYKPGWAFIQNKLRGAHKND
jgi:superfamily II DNA or RNA helicase